MEALQNELIKAFNALTGISTKLMTDYSQDHNIIDILHHPNVLGNLPDKQSTKLAALIKLVSGYQHLSEFSRLNTITIDSTGKAADFFAGILSLQHSREYFMVAFLDKRNQVVDLLSFKGTLDSCPVYPRDVLIMALSLDAGAVILAHNHPTGHSNPSQIDVVSTQKFVNIFVPLDIQVLDHIIVGGSSTYSMAEHMDLDFRCTTGDANYNVFDPNEDHAIYKSSKFEYEEEWEI